MSGLIVRLRSGSWLILVRVRGGSFDSGGGEGDLRGWAAAGFSGTRVGWPGIRDFEATRRTLIAGLLDNWVVGGQIGGIGWCGETGLVGVETLVSMRCKT